jgi:hypothetical protein
MPRRRVSIRGSNPQHRNNLGKHGTELGSEPQQKPQQGETGPQHLEDVTKVAALSSCWMKWRESGPAKARIAPPGAKSFRTGSSYNAESIR